MVASLFQRIQTLVQRLISSIAIIQRRTSRIKSLGYTSRLDIPIAVINSGLGATCGAPLCVRASLNYEDFYQFQTSTNVIDKLRQIASVTLMALDLRKYHDFEHYKKTLKKNSYFLRSNKKAVQNGYWVEQFQYQNHTPDMREIRQSIDERAQGLPADPFVLTDQALNKDPTALTPIEYPKCPQHWELWFGVFKHVPGYMQGTLELNKKLVAYARLRRIGNTIKYAEFIGHGEHLQFSVMIMLHIHLIEWIMNNTNPHSEGVQYVTYNTVEKGEDGILFWKRKALFTPFVIHTLEPELPEDFDAKTYLRLNPDLKETENEASLHYIRHGLNEKRLYKLDLPDGFDPDVYLKLNVDLDQHKTDPEIHYLLHGKNEGRNFK